MNYRETFTTPRASRLTGVNKPRGRGLVELEKVVRYLPCHIRARSTDNVECEGPIVTVLIILITGIGLRFWGPYHIQKLKKIGVRMGTVNFFFLIRDVRGVVFGHAH